MARRPYQVRNATLSTNGKGACTHCGAPATKEALFKNGSAVIVEKYCDACVEPEQFAALQRFYKLD